MASHRISDRKLAALTAEFRAAKLQDLRAATALVSIWNGGSSLQASAEAKAVKQFKLTDEQWKRLVLDER